MKEMEKTTTLSAAVTESSTLLTPGGPVQRKGKKKRTTSSSASASSIAYRGYNIYQSAQQGSLPVCVLLWGMASAKRVNLMTPDQDGNNPLHMAAMADTPEVVNFLLQQTRGFFSDDVKLVDARNHAGETPLMKTMSTGNFNVAKALIDEGSDPLATDAQGNSMFTLLAKSGHIWCLNSMYHLICNIHGTQVALELMSTLDNEAHSALDWAADYGDVNVLEFFIRKGLNPLRVDGLNRTALYWAVKSNRLEVIRFLLKVGCNPMQKDFKDQTPMTLAVKNDHQEAHAMMKAFTYLKAFDYLNPITPKLYSESNGLKQSHAIYLHNTSSLFMACSYGVIFFVFWVLTAVIPWYVWCVLFGATIYAYRLPAVQEPTKDGKYKRFVIGFNKFMSAPEKGIGFWLGSMSIYAIYLYSSFCTDTNTADSTLSHGDVLNPLQLQAIDSWEYDQELFSLAALSFLCAVGIWCKFMLCNSNPGIINTREADFEEVLAQSLLANGPPPSGQYCRTTFVKKPLRSKYCKKINCVVARMDHYCIWLNLTIGSQNHRTFVVLLLAHFVAIASGCILCIKCLARELTHGDLCSALQILLARDYFLITVLSAALCIATMGLGALLYVQLTNIASNITVNECINRARYAYLQDLQGQPRNRFDKGILTNWLEFLQVPGFAVDYTTLFDLPPELTQENMRLNEAMSKTKGMFGVNSNALHALFGTQSVSGPPSLDMEMINRPGYAESTDSGDTGNSAEVFV